ncbi:thioredoxin TrxA [Candidatus Palibaumannia cicadellinicola]|uniref:Thioredoxin n=1 Tax=Candidatus Palibaumannia cicadellinicola TaxID=186490 RepID=A0A0K2BKQ5_9GAMM|nr:thioredoxin TrxA [Candidatus Baumannia cicadellinicola]AKZ65774.1 Thioredoxin [Candidatus Baumannia cicadellinicola]
MNENIINISNNDCFVTNILQKEGLFLVDFWAEWCGPCNMIAPIISEIANEFQGKIIVAKVNIEENQVIATKYGIRSIPTFCLFRNGEVVATKVGALSKGQLKNFIKAHISFI